MNYFLLIVALIFAGLAVWRIFSKRGESAAVSLGVQAVPKPKPQKRRANFGGFDPKIENVGPGGVIKLTAVGPEMKDLDARIVSRHLYRERDDEWFELEGETEEGRLWIDVEEDDEVEVSVSLRALDLEETGLSPEDLDNMTKAKRGVCEFEGQNYRLRETGKARFYRDGDPSQGKIVRYWDFSTQDESSLLGFERWGKAEYEVHLGQPIRPHQITVYAEKGES